LPADQKVVVMKSRARNIGILMIAVIVVALSAFGLGRASADTRSARSRGYQSGVTDGYFQALPVGEAQGRRDGRALQEGDELPANERQPVRDAFDAGYAAGTNDAFAGYDGGWATSTPYVVTVQPGKGDITYRIASRVPLEPHVNYYLC
jgi:hypothetical protein